MVIVALLVFLVLVALAWWVVMRWLNNDGFPVRASLDEGGSAPPGGLGQAKDRNVAQTWDPEL
jgi:hypothetical protein